MLGYFFIGKTSRSETACPASSGFESCHPYRSCNSAWVNINDVLDSPRCKKNPFPDGRTTIPAKNVNEKPKKGVGR